MANLSARFFLVVCGVSNKTRAYSLGRYCRDERTGELLHVLSDVRRVQSSTVSTIWYEGINKVTDMQERIDLICDAPLFSSGRVVASVLSCERSVKQRMTPPVPPVLPLGPLDFSNQTRNTLCHLGESHDFSLNAADGFRNNVLAPLRRGDVRGQSPVFRESLISCDEASPMTTAIRLRMMETATQFCLQRNCPLEGMSVVVGMFRMALSMSRSRILSGAQDALTVSMTEPLWPYDAASGSSFPVDIMPIVNAHPNSDTPDIALLDVPLDDRIRPSPQDPSQAADWYAMSPIESRASCLEADLRAGQPISGLVPSGGSAVGPAAIGPVESTNVTSALGSVPSGVSKKEWLQHQKVERRRLNNIAAAKRSNAKRRAAYKTLENSLELLKSLEAVLVTRMEELVAENMEMSSQLQSLGVTEGFSDKTLNCPTWS